MQAKDIPLEDAGRQVINWIRAHTKAVLIVFVAVFLVGLLGGVVLVTGVIRWDYVFGVGLIFLLLGLALFDSLAESQRKSDFGAQ